MSDLLMEDARNISKEFFDENKCYSKSNKRKRGGPYNKSDREKRRAEVSRLHFDFGYTATQISKLMNVNRNTINSDINHGYEQLYHEWHIYGLESIAMKQMHRLESQRTRILEELPKEKNLKDKISLEKLILEIDGKIVQVVQKLMTSKDNIEDQVLEYANYIVDEVRWKHCNYINWKNILKVTKEAREKIDKIIKEDKKNQANKWGF